MVKVEGRKIEAKPDEILIGNVAYPRTLNVNLTFPEWVNAKDYVLNTWDEGNTALSSSQLFGGLRFSPMTVEALGENQFLARTRDVTPLFRDINLALRGEGVVYDTSGNLIEGERLTQLGKFVNNALVYTNDQFEKGTGFKGLDVVHVMGRNGDTLQIERQPLEEYAINCWADVQGEMNSQGYFTQRAPVQKFEEGRTIYQTKPVKGRVVGLDAGSAGASLDAEGDPQYADPLLGGILCAEGTPQKIKEDKQ